MDRSELKSKSIVFGVLVVVALLCLLPTITKGSFAPKWLPRPLSLGLDLKGGVHLVYQVDTVEAVKTKLQSLAQSSRSALRKEKVAVTRANVNPQSQLEIALFSDRFVDKAKEVISSQFPDLGFVTQSLADGKAVLTFAFKDADVENLKKQSVSQAVETLRNRVDQFGVAEPLIQRVGIDRIMLQMPGVTDIESVKKIVGSVAKLEFRFVAEGSGTEGRIKLKTREGGTLEVEDEVAMSGDAVASARAGFANNQPDVSLSLTKEGAQTFYHITQDHVGRRLAIILDGVIYSSPNIREPIAGGQASISGGSFSLDEVRQLAIVLRAGALPAPLKVMEQRTVGPTLGQESVEKGVTAILVGFAAIVAFVLFYYKKAGIVASFSLMINLFFLVAILSAFGATITLPGMAGLALTAGMAVDSNVIIFERIKDELRIGAGAQAAVSAGFEKAFSAILDTNLCTLISALVLYWLGSGPIRGFAVTLAAGIITTLYCAITVCKIAFNYFELRGKNETLSI